MATVVALQSFVGVLETDVLGEDRIEKHSEFANPSVFPGGKYFPDDHRLAGKPQGAGSLLVNVKKPGRKVDVVKGQRFEDNHPAVKKWPEMFGLAQSHPEVEAATAAPGEKRGR